MNEFRIFINEKYNRNKYIIWVFIIVVSMFLMVNYILGQVRDSKNITISEGGSNSRFTVKEKIQEIKNRDVEEHYNDIHAEMYKVNAKNEDYIELFIEFCNSGKINNAYEMISDDCKRAIYPTIDVFIKNYYSVIFKTNKNYKIISFENDTYKVTYLESAIYSGVEQDSGILDYITVLPNGHLNISEFIEMEDLNKVAVSTYCSFSFKKRIRYINYDEYTVVIKNFTKADLYVDYLSNSNLYIEDTAGNKFYIDEGEYFDEQFMVLAGEERELSLKFNVKNITKLGKNKIKKMCFGNMKIINKEYVDDTAMNYDTNTGEYVYETRKTQYLPFDSFIVNF